MLSTSSSSFSTVLKLISTSFSLFFNVILTHSYYFSNEATLEEEGSWGAQRDEEEEERNRKNRFKGKFAFSSMGIFNGVYREINGGVNRISHILVKIDKEFNKKVV